MKVLLDTNAYSDLARGRPWVVRRIRSASEVLIPAVVAGELLGGFRRGTRYDENVDDLERFLAQPRVQLVPMAWTTADRYGRIYVALRRRGTPIPTNDMWIAAQAMETGAELLSADPHFGQVDGLAWTDTGG